MLDELYITWRAKLATFCDIELRKYDLKKTVWARLQNPIWKTHIWCTCKTIFWTTILPRVELCESDGLSIPENVRNLDHTAEFELNVDA